MSQDNSQPHNRQSDSFSMDVRRIRPHIGLNVAQDALEENLTLLGLMTSGVMHDIRGACAVVVLAQSLLTQRFNQGEYEKMSEYLPAIESGVNLIASLCNEGFSVVDGGGETCPLTTAVDMAVCEEAIHFLNADIEIVTKNIFGEDTPLVNRYKVKRMLHNLIGNACGVLTRNPKRSVGGLVTVTIHPMKRKSDRELLPEENSFVGLTVADNGPGMTAEVFSKICMPFFTTKEKGEGTGLGLYTTAHIIDHMGGALLVSTAEDRGTQFTLCFPLH